MDRSNLLARAARTSAALSAFVLVGACASPMPVADAGPEAAVVLDAAPEVVTPVVRCEPHTPACIDLSLTQLNFLTEPSTGEITTEGELAVIDASAGGRMPTESFVYARFTERGLEKVAIHDEDSLGSTEWDIAFRRGTVRLNSGVSGPSCVEGTEAPEGATYESITRVAPATSFRPESYFTPLNCYYVTDGSGMGSPGTVLSGYRRLSNCVQMTGEVYLIRLRDDRVVKLQVRAYYNPDVQRLCDEGADIPGSDNGAATYRLRWAFVPR